MRAVRVFSLLVQEVHQTEVCWFLLYNVLDLVSKCVSYTDVGDKVLLGSYTPLRQKLSKRLN